MTLTVDRQSCGNCFFARTMSFVNPNSGSNSNIGNTYQALACCFPAPGTMANRPTLKTPWREVDPLWWCGQWSDVSGAAAIVTAVGTAVLDFGTTPAVSASVPVAENIPVDANVKISVQDDAVAGTVLRLTPIDIDPTHGFTIFALSDGPLVTGPVTVNWSWNA